MKIAIPKERRAHEARVAASPETVKKLPSHKDYMEKFINPPEFMEAQKAKLEAQEKAGKKFPAEPQKDIMLFLLLSETKIHKPSISYQYLLLLMDLELTPVLYRLNGT